MRALISLWMRVAGNGLWDGNEGRTWFGRMHGMIGQRARGRPAEGEDEHPFAVHESGDHLAVQTKRWDSVADALFNPRKDG